MCPRETELPNEEVESRFSSNLINNSFKFLETFCEHKPMSRLPAALTATTNCNNFHKNATRIAHQSASSSGTTLCLSVLATLLQLQTSVAVCSTQQCSTTEAENQERAFRFSFSSCCHNYLQKQPNSFHVAWRRLINWKAG
jgi:hypothetical protein